MNPNSMQRDANRVPIQSDTALLISKQVAFSGAAGNGAVGSVPLFTVTGDVIATVYATCSEDLAGATATLEVGVSGLTAGLIAQTVATDIDAGEVWKDTAPALIESLPTPSIIANGADIIATVGTANITDGTLTFYCAYRPLSVGATIIPV